MRKKLIVKQNGFKDCAGSCLLSLIRYYNGDISKEELSFLIKTNEHGTNAYNMIEGMKKIGFDGYGLKVEKNQILNNLKELPFIAHVKLNNMLHYIVVYEINIKKKYLKIMDPSFGKRKISFEEFNDMFLETILVFYPVNIIPKLKYKMSLISYLSKYILIKKETIKYLILLSIIIMIFTLINNLYFKIIIDYILINFSLKLLITISIVFIFLIVFKNILNIIRGKLLLEINSFISKSITIDTIRHIFYLPYQFFKSKPTGEVSSRINELNSFKNLLSELFLSLFIDLFLIIMSMFILLIINKTLFIISLIIVFIYSLIVIFYSKIFKNKIYFIQSNEAEYNKDLIESLENYESIKNLNITSKILNKLEMKYISLIHKIKDLEKTLFIQSSFKNIVVEFGIVLILCIGSYLIYKKVITLGDLVAFNTLLLFFLEPIRNLLDLEPNIRECLTSFDRIKDLLMIEKEDTNFINSKINGDITIKNLSYSYNDYDYLFKDINLTIRKGDKLLIHGKSGVGKSTLIKILLGYINNYNGIININNINILDLKKDIINNSFTYISQQEKLFTDTFEKNILLDRKIKLNEYEEVLKITNAYKIRDKNKLRNRYFIEENGFNLSGGERQKIILARALLKQSNFLIFDEALSEVGVDEEKEIINKILKKFKDKTIIYISHKKEIIDIFENKYMFYQKGEVC